MRVLLAEDEEDLNRIITKKLISQGYSVDSCYDGEEAIDSLSLVDYDAVILDIMMPKADGFTVLRHREDDAGVVFDGAGRSGRPRKRLRQRCQ